MGVTNHLLAGMILQVEGGFLKSREGGHLPGSLYEWFSTNQPPRKVDGQNQGVGG